MDEIHEEEHHTHLARIKAKLLCSQQGQGDHPDGVVDEHEEIRRHRGDLAERVGTTVGLASSRAVRPVCGIAARIRANDEPARSTPETPVDNQNTARQLSSAVRYPPVRRPALPPAPVERLKAVMAAPPPGRARNTESNPAVANSATPTPWMPRAGSSVACEAATAASPEPSKSAADPATAVHFGPTRSTSQAAGRLVTSRPAKKTEKTSPAPVALSASDSWTAGSAGDTMSTHQYAKNRMASEMRCGSAVEVVVSIASGLDTCGCPSSPTVHPLKPDPALLPYSAPLTRIPAWWRSRLRVSGADYPSRHDRATRCPRHRIPD